jgi:DNA-binding CsgD family transcriptional regulator/tetratricopeptide (TPR) repeat protein
VSIRGEPGIGRSALFRAVLSEADQAGCRVYAAQADEWARELPLRAMLDCLRADLPPTGLDARAVDDVASQLVTLVERAAGRSPVVVGIDDLHWADPATLLVWRCLAELAGRYPLMLLDTDRRVDSPTPVPDGRDVLVLAPLSPTDVTELAQVWLGRSLGERLASVAAQAAGNPSYLRELLDALTRERLVELGPGMAELTDNARLERLPASLRAAIADRLAGLGEHGLHVLRVAALMDAGVSAPLLGEMVGQPEAVVETVLESAGSAGVLTPTDTGGWEFHHPLIRQALYEGLPAAMRVALHWQLASILPRVNAPAEQVARHLLRSGDLLDDWVGDTVMDWLVDAAPLVAQRAPMLAAELLERVLSQHRPADPRDEALQAALATAHVLLGHNEQAELVARQLLTRTADETLAAEAAWALADALLRSGRLDQALDVLADALNRYHGSDAWPARLRALQVEIMCLPRQPGPAVAEPIAAAAVAQAQRSGDPLALGYALRAQAGVRSEQARYDDAADHLRAAAEAVGDDPRATDLRLAVAADRALSLADLDHPGQARGVLRPALVDAQRVGSPRLNTLRANAAELAFLAGDFDEALNGLNSAGEMPDSRVTRRMRAVMANIAARQGNWSVAVEHVEREAGPVSLLTMLCRAMIHERDNDLALAQAALMPVLDGGRSARLGAGSLGLPRLVRLALSNEDIAAAHRVLDVVHAWVTQAGTVGARAAEGRCRGLVERDPSLLLAAASSLRRVGWGLSCAEALEDAAVALALTGDLRAARAAHHDVTELYASMHAEWDVRRVDARMRAYGVRRGAGAREKRPATGWSALTPTERRIAQLVGEGRSNPDIAVDLVISRRTVQTHVSKILTKLGAHTRAGIAREVNRHTDPGDGH